MQAYQQQSGSRLVSAALRAAFWLVDDLPAALESALNSDPRGPGLVPAHLYPKDAAWRGPAHVDGVGENGTTVRAAAVDSEAGPMPTERVPAVALTPKMPAGYLQHDSGEL